MSILAAIFQAIGQALTWILPVSESGHSAIFHDLSGRYTDACSQLTGAIHIGIAIGIFIAFFKLFITMGRHFFQSGVGLFQRNLSIRKANSSRKFMYCTVLSFLPLLLYLIPAGEYGNVYGFLRHFACDGNLLSEGICFVLTGILLTAAVVMMKGSMKGNSFRWIYALLLGLAVFVSIPVSGLSLIVSVFSLGILFKYPKAYALRYAAVMSVPVLIVMGIAELVTAVTVITVFTAVMGVLAAAVASFFLSRLLVWIINHGHLKYFVYYDFGIGAICLAIGAVELI